MRILGLNAAKEKLEIVKSRGGAAPLKTAKEPVEKYRIEPYFVKENFFISFIAEILGNFCFLIANSGLIVNSVGLESLSADQNFNYHSVSSLGV
ncbi:MAG: hypothetical protein WC430_01260 [Patescibacteria group bacterium]